MGTGGAGFGFQIGAEVTEFVMILNEEILSGKVTPPPGARRMLQVLTSQILARQ
jgi:lipid-binding SYLF domain-containing protein